MGLSSVDAFKALSAGCGRKTIWLIIASILAGGLSACGDKKADPYFVFTPPANGRPLDCPPGGLPLSEQAESPEDADISGDGTTDLFLGRYHWGGYYNLTVEVWCVNGTYFSMRVWESVNGTEYLKLRPIAPGREGAGGPSDLGECCPYINGKNRGPFFEHDPPIDDEKDAKSPPVRVDWISRNPHVPGQDGASLEDYKKTLIWTQTNFNKTIVGRITMVHQAGPPVTYSFQFTGEFVVSSSKLQDGSKPAGDLTEDDKKELLKLFKKEKESVDRGNPNLPAIPWPLPE
ncbi:hypothetical protein [Bradyrhizobium sp.]